MYKIVTDSKKDKFKLMHIYLTIIHERNPKKLTYDQLTTILRNEFGLEVTIGELDVYFEPTLGEESLDNTLMANNLMSGYD